MRPFVLVVALLLAAGCGAAEPSAEGEAESEAESEGGPTCAEAPPLAECFAGAAFADCGGDGAPVVGCASDPGGDVGRCVWFTGGCVAQGFATGCDVDDPAAYEEDCFACWWLAWTRGVEPWDRERAMALDVMFDASLEVAATEASCTGCDPCGPWDMCGDYSITARGAMPGTLVIGFRADWGCAHGEFGQIEIDLDALGARFCRLPVTDAWGCGNPPVAEPSCATSGALMLSAAPSSDAEVPGLAGTLSASFDDGLVVEASFVVEEALVWWVF